MLKPKQTLTLLAGALLFTNVFAITTTIYSGGEDMQRINSLAIFEDKSAELTLTDVLDTATFRNSELEIPNLGVSSSVFWIKFVINNTSENSQLALMLEAPTIDEVELHVLKDGIAVNVIQLGENQPFSYRTYQDPNYIFDIDIPKNGSVTYLLKVKSIDQMMIPLSIGTPAAVRDSISINNLIFGLYSGFILVMFFYNLFVYFIVRDESYFYYVAYLLFIGLTQISLKGYTFKYLWPDSTWLAGHSVVLLSSIAAIAGMLFIRSFLNTKKYTPKLDRGLDIINGVFVLSIILSILGMGEGSFKLMQLDTMFCSFYGLFIGYRIARMDYRPAKFFLLAWTILLGGAIIFVFKDFGIIPYNRFTGYTLQISSALETILLSLALADRINIFKKEKEEAQARELRERKEKQDILVKQAEMLKTKVEEATHELREKNDQLNESNSRLEDTLLKLKATQAELVQKQKMASLGQLAAGVAHEVNNSINIINTSLDVLERDFKDLRDCVDRFRAIESNVEGLKEKVLEAQKYTEEVEYVEVLEEIDKTMERARRGVSRTASITQELKSFSKIDSEGFSSANVNNDLDAMLDMLRPSLGEIQVNKSYGDVQDVKCNSQKMNQIYQNIITNSIEAILKKGIPQNEGKIDVVTEQHGDNVTISFTDNGIGMTDEVKEKAFDPFFTTKGVEGKGLGLANVYGTINEHNGSVQVESSVNVGTTIKLTLPVSI